MPHRVWAHQPKVLASKEGHEFFGEIEGAWGRERAPQPRCGARGFSVVAPRAHSPTISSSRSMSGADHLVPSSTLAPRSMSSPPPPPPPKSPSMSSTRRLLHVQHPPPSSTSGARRPIPSLTPVPRSMSDARLPMPGSRRPSIRAGYASVDLRPPPRPALGSSADDEGRRGHVRPGKKIRRRGRR
ncbi:hypothetical protein DAI22_05g194300 [Oryza sativa Japonica Group]|nr:hypothetical protein DAI22_05g194300 [Oryza sativa Japonica Group]